MASKQSLPPRQMYELKKKAQEYYEQNGVPKKMEEILNSMFYDNPADVYGHLANYFGSFAVKPAITKVAAREVLDSKGQITLQAEVYGRVKNNEKLLSTAECSNENFHPEHARPEEKEDEDEERKEALASALNFISGDMGASVVSLDPTDQAAVDAAILAVITKIIEEKKKAEEETEVKEEAEPETERRASLAEGSSAKAKAKGKAKGPAVEVIPDEPREQLVPGCNAICALSQAVCSAGAKVSDIDLYEHVAKLAGQSVDSLSLPTPMITMLSAGRAGAGKAKGVKEFMIIPRHDMPITEVIKHSSNIFNIVGKSMAGKTPPRSAKKSVTPLSGAIKLFNDIGAVCPPLDRLEQGLDMLTDAISQIGLSVGQDFFFALNCAVHEVFDFEKGKYEAVTGQQKDGEGLAEVWADIVNRYPAVVALIDPLRKQDKEAWTNLAEKISKQCLIIGDFVRHRPGLLKEELLAEEVKTSGVVMKLEQMNSVSDIIAASNKMKEENNHVVLGTSIGENTGSFMADLAVGIGTRFLKTGGPCRGERVSKLNRLVQIEACLKESDKFKQKDSLNFPDLTPPPPAEESESETKDTDPDKTDEQSQQT